MYPMFNTQSTSFKQGDMFTNIETKRLLLKCIDRSDRDDSQILVERIEVEK